MRRVLIISPAFPPKNTPELQRVRMSLPYYRENGWEPIVLAVEPTAVEAPDEPALLATVPFDIAVHRCKAISPHIGRRFGLGNLGWRAWLPLARAGARLIREERIDLVFFSTTQFALLPLGRIWQALLGAPYVVDLQDPWRTDFYERPGARRPPGGWKYQLARAQAALLEPWSLRQLSGLISVSAVYLQDLNRRYRWFKRIPTATIPFGASENDIATALTANSMATGSLVPPARADNDSDRPLHLVYTGVAITPEAVCVLFAALRAFREQAPAKAARFRFDFIGTNYAPPDRAQPSILPWAEKFGVADLVSERPSRAGHLECVRVQASADVLVLLGSSDRAYSASKLYPYFLAARPILALVFRESVMEKLLHDLGGARIAAFSEDETTEAHETLLAYFSELTERGAVLPTNRNEMYFNQHYLARTLTARQSQLFDRALTFSQTDATVI